MERVTGQNHVISNIKEAEPIGPEKLLDLLVIAPCTGNTLAKLSAGVADTAVTMAAKAHLRNGRPVVVAVSTNDGLGTAAKKHRRAFMPEAILLCPIPSGRSGREADIAGF